MKKYPFVKQSIEKDCGASCVLMAIKYYHGDVSLDELIERTKTTKEGTTAYHLTETLKEFNFDAYGIKKDFNELISDNIVLPCIAHVTIDNKFNHFVVIYEINKKKNYLIIADPGKKILKIKYSSFRKIYNGIIIFFIPLKQIPIINYRDYSFIYNIIKKNKKYIIKLIILSLIVTFLSIISSFFLYFIINSINYNSYKLLIIIFIIFTSISLVRIIIDYFRNKILININQKIDFCLTTDVFNKIIELPYYYYRNRTTGDVISRINDLSIIRDSISTVALSLFIDLPLAIITLVILYLINNKLFLITIIVLIFYVICIKIFKNSYLKNIDKYQRKKADINSYMVESISGFETIKGIHIENKIKIKFYKKYQEYQKIIGKYSNNYFKQHVFKDLINDVGNMVIIFIGSLLIINNIFSVAMLITFFTLVNLFLEPIKNIVDLNNNINESKNILKRITELMSKKNIDGLIKETNNFDININKLNYSFNDRNYILKNINLNIKSKSKVIVIGKSGSGKSTLFKILLKYYKIDANKVFINNVDINNLRNNFINNNIIYIGQNEMLFNDTIYNNINIDNNDQEKFLKVIKSCFVDELINTNLGYNQIIEENGFNISGGQKQRIILARTLLRSFNILIIDEGLNQLDINLERKILKNLFSMYPDKTIIVISHRLDNIDLFDQMLELKQGKIIKNIKK